MVSGSFVSITSFISVVLIARVLGVEGAGIVAFALWVAFTGAIVADPGTSTALPRYLPELRLKGKEHADALAAAMLRWVLAALAPTLLVLLGIYLWAPTGLSSATWAMIVVLTVLQTFSMNFSAYLRGMQWFHCVAVVAFWSSLLQISVLAVGLFSLGADGALLGYVAGALLPAVLACRILLGPAGIPNALRQRVYWFAGLNWGMAVIGAVVWYRAELFFLQISHGSESVGLFSTGLTLSNIATMFPALLLGALLPHFSGQIGRNEIKELHSTYVRFTRIIAFLIFPICFGLAALCPVLIPLLFGPGFAPAVPSAMIVVAGSAIAVAVATNGNVLMGFERTKLLFSANIVGLVLMMAGGLTVIPLYGLEGAAVTRVVVQLAIVSIEFWYVAYHLKFDVPSSSLLKTFSAAMICAIVAFTCVSAIGGVVSLFVGIPLAAIVYVASIRALGALQAEDRTSLESVVQRMPRPLHGVLLKCVALVLPASTRAGSDTT